MANIEDYILWRGDIPFKVSDFNEADALILCQLSYIDFDGIVSENFKSGITIKEAAQNMRCATRKRSGRLRRFYKSPIGAALEAAGNSVRFSGIVLKGFVNEIDLKAEKQFSAITAVLSPKKAASSTAELTTRSSAGKKTSIWPQTIRFRRSRRL